MKIRCTTKFDITATGVTGHYKPSRVPFQDQHGRIIEDLQGWNHSRNQQRNWETITQLLGLRTQIDMDMPARQGSTWQFDFTVESEEIFVDGDDELALLKRDCEGVPMITGLGETQELHPWLDVLSSDPNICFAIIPVNNG